MSAETDHEYRQVSDLVTGDSRALGGQIVIPGAFAKVVLEEMQIFRDIRAELRKLNAKVQAMPQPSSVTIEY